MGKNRTRPSLSVDHAHVGPPKKSRRSSSGVLLLTSANLASRGQWTNNATMPRFLFSDEYSRKRYDLFRSVGEGSSYDLYASTLTGCGYGMWQMQTSTASKGGTLCPNPDRSWYRRWPSRMEEAPRPASSVWLHLPKATAITRGIIQRYNRYGDAPFVITQCVSPFFLRVPRIDSISWRADEWHGFMLLHWNVSIFLW